MDQKRAVTKGSSFVMSGIYKKEKTPECNHSDVLWRRHPDLNWGIKVLQTSALPLGYAAICVRMPNRHPNLIG